MFEAFATNSCFSVYVDTTPPLKGIVSDGIDPNTDIRYTSEPATVASTWKEFSDPESGIQSYVIDVYRKTGGESLSWLCII